MKRRTFFAKLTVALASAVAVAATTAVASKAQAQGSYYNQRNTQDRDYKRMQDSTRRAYGR